MHSPGQRIADSSIDSQSLDPRHRRDNQPVVFQATAIPAAEQFMG